MFSVIEVMNTELFTLGEDNTVMEARELMSVHHIRHIPVVGGNNRLLGLVSQRDVLAAADSTLLVSPRDAQAQEAFVSVASIMTVSVNTIEETASLRGAALYMQKHKIGCLPVMRGESLVGIITDSDFIAVAINLMEQMEELEPEEIEY
jgi:CBS domain-containing membrane protein